MVAADYTLSPSITFSDGNAGGIGGVVGGLLGNSAIGTVVGGMQMKDAGTVLTLIDNRSGVQLAAAEGSARKMDFAGVGGLLGRRGGAGMGGYTSTAQGKVIVAAFVDSFAGMCGRRSPTRRKGCASCTSHCFLRPTVEKMSRRYRCPLPQPFSAFLTALSNSPIETTPFRSRSAAGQVATLPLSASLTATISSPILTSSSPLQSPTQLEIGGVGGGVRVRVLVGV